MSRLLTLYSREHCHLCHDMLAALEVLQPCYQFLLEVIDVDDNEALEARYGEFVPVLVGADGKEICHYRLDHDALDTYLKAAE